MADVLWAQQQVINGNSVKRASIPSVYVKLHEPSWSTYAVRGAFFTSGDILATPYHHYMFSMEDCAATDWELHSSTGAQMNWSQANTEIKNGNKVQRLAYPQVMIVGHFDPPGTFQREFLFDVSETNLIEANALESDYSYSMDDVSATDWVLVP